MSDRIVDAAGEIINILFDDRISHIAVISSRKGTTRSNHWHKTSSHTLYVLSGLMRYSERKLDGSDSKTLLVKRGQSVFTGPNLVHKTEFLENTVLISCTDNKSQEKHAADVVKEEF